MMTAASDTGSGVARSLVPARMDRNKTSYSPRPAALRDHRIGRRMSETAVGGPRAGFALLLSLSMAQFMVVLDTMHRS